MKSIPVVFDVESTGLEHGSRLVEIAAIILGEDGSEVSRFNQLINPGMPIPADASSVNSITDDVLVGKPDAGAVLRDFMEWLADSTKESIVGVAHFASYDQGVIGYELGRFGIPLPGFEVACTWQMAKNHGATKNNKLETLIEHHNIMRLGAAHRAYSDADACRQVFNLLKGTTTWNSAPWASDHQYTDVLPPALAKLPEMVATGREISFGYTDEKNVHTDRTITPFGWAERNGVVCFHGWDASRAARRTFRADRVDA